MLSTGREGKYGTRCFGKSGGVWCADVERPTQRVGLAVDRGRRLLRVEPLPLIAFERGGGHVHRGFTDLAEVTGGFGALRVMLADR